VTIDSDDAVMHYGVIALIGLLAATAAAAENVTGTSCLLMSPFYK